MGTGYFGQLYFGQYYPTYEGVANLSIDVFDSVTVSESVTPQEVNNPSVFDSITVSESVSPQLVNNVNIFSSITVTESTQQAFTLKYTRGKYTSLPTDDTDLTTLFSGTEETDVLDYDSTTVDQTGDATNTISAFLFKVRVADNASPITVSWTGQSSLAPSSATVTLEIYNYNTSSWETLDTDRLYCCRYRLYFIR